MSVQDLVIVDSAAEAAATCIVCGKDIAAGEGVTARLDGQSLRFNCPGCVSRFALDPDRFLKGGPASCCEDKHGHTDLATPANDGLIHVESLRAG